MTDREFRRFVRRHNQDGTVDSICLRCFLTIGTAHDQSALQEFETTHQCTYETNDWLLSSPKLQTMK